MILKAVVAASSAPVPVITQHPQDSNAINTGTVTFTVTATSASALSYQWQVNTGSSWANISGATSNVYTRTAVTGDNGYLFRCVVTNAGGSTNSNSATLTIVAGTDLSRVASVQLEVFGYVYDFVQQDVASVQLEVFGSVDA